MHSLQNHTQNHAFLVEQKAYFNRKREKLQEKSLEIFLAVSHVTDARNCRTKKILVAHHQKIRETCKMKHADCRLYATMGLGP